MDKIKFLITQTIKINSKTYNQYISDFIFCMSGEYIICLYFFMLINLIQKNISNVF